MPPPCRKGSISTSRCSSAAQSVNSSSMSVIPNRRRQQGVLRDGGIRVDELVGQDLAVIFPLGQSPANDILERVSDAASEGYVAQRFLQRRDGTILPALATTAVMRDEDGAFRLLVSLQDQTRQRASDNLEWRSQALIDGAIAALPMTFTAFDTNLRFTYVPAACRNTERFPRYSSGDTCANSRRTGQRLWRFETLSWDTSRPPDGGEW